MNNFTKHPILLIAYSRPVHMSKVLAKIANYFPDELYIFIDGLPDNANSKLTNLHQEVIKIAKGFDKAINVSIYLSPVNLGCGKGPHTAIDWVFLRENSAIILEDDVLPTKRFFEYIDENLATLEDSTCMMISSNKYDRFPQFNKSIKTRYCFTNGWATWKRAWSVYSYRLSTPIFDNIEAILKHNLSVLSRESDWMDIVCKVRTGDTISFWDYQWQLSVWANNGWSLQPPKNLTTNIGFDEFGTHTKNGDWRATIKAVETLNKIKPSYNEVGRLHDFIISLYITSLPGYIFRKFKIKI
jgi:GR25 family glycosyltransferase involved in LPS biosynthesis